MMGIYKVEKYKWEKSSYEKYGEEVTLSLIKEQQEYEHEKKDNNCSSCGYKNDGTIVELNCGTPILIHYGLWSGETCLICHKSI